MPRVKNSLALGFARPPAAGFTLLELLVVLAILGLVAATALPQLSTLADRIEFALNRETFERSLSQLPYEAYKHRQDFVLGQLRSPNTLEEGEEALTRFRLESEDSETTVNIEGPILVTAAPLHLPQGWRLKASKPIIFRSTGLCSGGTVELRVESAVYEYELAPPQCLPVPK
jgi:general secretion pathway protein G